MFIVLTMQHQSFFFYFFFFLIYCSGCCHTSKWISHGFTCVPHPDPPSYLPLHPIPLGLPSAPGPSACLMHPTWAGDLPHPRQYTCFDAALLKHPTLAFSHRVQKSVLYICVSPSVLHTGLSLTSIFKIKLSIIWIVHGNKEQGRKVESWAEGKNSKRPPLSLSKCFIFNKFNKFADVASWYEHYWLQFSPSVVSDSFWPHGL